ncbi:hypothetical protein [Streptococcus equi]|uniref:hypothetical protein n=1 Tax=Streptococcus equi TaxID=1336 RepID=UPI001E62295A|nr:hypothetical protein [Streptococcus equi]
MIAYQVSLSDGFYDKYTKLWDKTYSFDFVINHRAFYAQLTKRCVYDVLLQTLEKISRKAIAKQLAELEALVDVSESKEDFQIFSRKNTNYHFLIEELCLSKEKGTFRFDRNLWIALHYNPRKERDT